MAEAHGNRSMLMPFGGPTIFLTRPMALTLLVLAVLMLVAPTLLEQRFARISE